MSGTGTETCHLVEATAGDLQAPDPRTPEQNHWRDQAGRQGRVWVQEDPGETWHPAERKGGLAQLIWVLTTSPQYKQTFSW